MTSIRCASPPGNTLAIAVSLPSAFRPSVRHFILSSASHGRTVAHDEFYSFFVASACMIAGHPAGGTEGRTDDGRQAEPGHICLSGIAHPSLET